MADGFKQRKIPAIYINEIRITPLLGELSHSLYIRSGEHEYTAAFDNNFSRFTDAVSTAIKFFGLKYGLIYIDDDGNVYPTNKGMD